MIPTSDIDLFADDVLAEPYEHYRRLRDLGPVVWLRAHDLYAVFRYGEVRYVLENPEVFCSGRGVGFNDFINAIGLGTTLMSDGDQHRRLRNVILRPLTPKALAQLRPNVRALADRLADQLVTEESSTPSRILPRFSRRPGCPGCSAGPTMPGTG